MQTETTPAALDEQKPSKRMRYDPTINLGHLLSLTAFLLAGGVAYTDLKQRVSLAEQRIQLVEATVADERVRIRESLADLKVDVRETRRAVETLATRK